jgi:hypothetical protein
MFASPKSETSIFHRFIPHSVHLIEQDGGGAEWQGYQFNRLSEVVVKSSCCISRMRATFRRLSRRKGFVQDYNVKPIGRTCAGTGRELVPGSLCHSVLIEKNGELQRFDYSDEGWSGPSPGFVAHWRCEVPEAVASSKKTFDADELMRQFEQLCEEASPAQDKFRYVLALLLLQRRRLKLEGTKSVDDQEFLELNGARGEGTFLILDQQLDDAEVQKMQEAIFGDRAA